MIVFPILRQALRSLQRHWVRSVLSVVGIAVGVAAFTCVVAIGHASTSAVREQLKSLGDNLIWIEAGSRNRNGIRLGARGTRSLVEADAAAITEQVPLIREITPNVDGHVQVVYRGENWATYYRGVTPAFLEVRRWKMSLGTFFHSTDVETASAVCVLGHTVADSLFSDQNPVGQTVRVQSLPCQVVGVLQKRGISPSGRDQDDFILMPFTTVQKRITGTFWLDDIFCSAVSPDSMTEATRQITALLRERHHLNPGEDNDFNVRHPEDAVQAQLATRRIMSLLLGSIASLSLIVGGIGIMNIMLVSVTQRTREIGIRLAIGATEGSIQFQFLAEAVAIAIAGGLLGVALGVLAAMVVPDLFGFSAELSNGILAAGAGFAIAVGVLFGYYPARKASQLDPIDALRYE